MNGRDILRNMHAADEKYVEETAEYKTTSEAKTVPRRVWLKVAAIAAAVALAATGTVVLLNRKPAGNNVAVTDNPQNEDKNYQVNATNDEQPTVAPEEVKPTVVPVTVKEIAFKTDVPLGVKIQTMSFFAEASETAMEEGIITQDSPSDVKLQEIVFGSEMDEEYDIEWRMASLGEKLLRYVDFRNTPRTTTVELNDKTYELSARWMFPICSPYDLSYVRYYNVDRITIDGEEYSLLEKGPVNSEECLDEAIQIAGTLIDTDDGAYKMSKSFDKEIGKVKYQRTLYGYDTCARLYVNVYRDFFNPLNENNDFIRVGIGRVMLDEMEALISSYDEACLQTTLDMFGSDTTEAAVKERLITSYPQMSEWETGTKLVVYAPNDELGMVYIMSTEYSGVTYNAMVLVTADYSNEGENYVEKEQRICVNELVRGKDENGNDLGVFVNGDKWSVGPLVSDPNNQGLFLDTMRSWIDGDVSERVYTGTLQQITATDYYFPMVTGVYDSGDAVLRYDCYGSLIQCDILKDKDGNLLSEKQGNKTVDDCRYEANLTISGDVSKYESTEKVEGSIITYEFERKICGYDTIAKASVVFNTCGELMHFDNGLSRIFNNRINEEDPDHLEALLAKLDSEETLASIDEKVKALNPDAGYEIQQKTVVVTPDYSIGMIFRVQVEGEAEARYYLVTREFVPVQKEPTEDVTIGEEPTEDASTEDVTIGDEPTADVLTEDLSTEDVTIGDEPTGEVTTEDTEPQEPIDSADENVTEPDGEQG